MTSEFGLQSLSGDLIERFEKLSAVKLPPLLRRNLIPFHRDFNLILDDVEAKRPIYIYTGRGPSSPNLHLGHLVPFMFTKFLQDAFDAQVVIQITDDEKFLFRGCSLEEVESNSCENIRDIIACGFQKHGTFIFQNTRYIQTLYPNILRIQSKITNSQCFATFGIRPDNNIGQTAFCATQAAPAFYTSFPTLFKTPRRCLIPCGEDQDPYFRLTRDVATKLGHLKPSLLCSKFIPSLKGVTEKMSSTDPQSVIFLTDSDQDIAKKIRKSVSGGQVSKEDQLTLGANLEVDVAYQYLRYFMDDDEEFDRITKYYGPDPAYTPKLMCGYVKSRAIEVVTKLIHEHHSARKLAQEKYQAMVYSEVY
jgi:tryptophanyl-tRNA synthetase